MQQSTKSKRAPAASDDRGRERRQRGDATGPTPAGQLGATERQVTPLTPPTSEKPAKQLPPEASTKQKAAEQIDPSDEITPG